MIIELNDDRDLDVLLDHSREEPVVVFKHSTQCGVSDGALDELNSFTASNPSVQCGLVLVLENRGLSNKVEHRFGIDHESPQAIVFKNAQPVWHASHRRITAKALKEATTHGSHEAPWQTA